MSDVPRLTREQAAIISLYTGFVAGDGSFGDAQELLSSKPGFEGIATLGMAMVGAERIRDACRDDFLAICYQREV